MLKTGHVLLLGIAAIGIMWGVSELTSRENTDVPRFETSPTFEVDAMLAFPTWFPGMPTGGVQDNLRHKWRLHPKYDDPGYPPTRHRYPIRVGGNITAVIHHGWDCLMKSAPHDRDWFESPPSDVMF